MAVVTVQFKVGVPRTEALVRLYDTINVEPDWLPRDLGVAEPLIKPKGIDDVPIVTLTLWTRRPRARRVRPRARRARDRGRAEARARHARGDDRSAAPAGRCTCCSIRSGSHAVPASRAADVRAGAAPRRMPRAGRRRSNADNRAMLRRDRPVPARMRATSQRWSSASHERQAGVPVARWRASSTARRRPSHYVWLGTGPAAARRARVGAGGESPGGDDRRHQEARRERGRRRRRA